ncbi:MAG: glutamate 5-kinase [Pseudomonadota bacterium]
MSGSLDRTRRLVVKIGSTLLVDEADGTIRRGWLDGLADDLAGLHRRGVEVLIVSSGAIAVGREHLGLGQQRIKGRPLKLEEKQAAAATGQIRLAHAYEETLARHGITVAQILLSPGDTEDRRRHLNARATLNQLLRLGAIPVINENDTVATAEIRYGDNDRLAARVAQMVSADALVLLSDIDGLYSADPKTDPTARHLDEVTEMTPSVEAMAGQARPGYSSGGMVTKLAAARLAMDAGCRMAITLGTNNNPIEALANGARATWFTPKAEPKTARKAWIGGALHPVGALTVDEGAAAALARGKSLLPAGVVSVNGRFERGDPVTVQTADGAVIGQGLCAYSADDARRILGQRSAAIEQVLGWRGRDEMIHRDDLAMR